MTRQADQGVVFDQNADVAMAFPGGRWTPTTTDVALAERLLAQQLGSLEAFPNYQQDKVAKIHASLADYRRQYVGFLDSAGKRCLWINFFRGDPDRHPQWRTRIVSVRGGGHGYFRVRVNLDEQRCYELRINSPK